MEWAVGGVAAARMQGAGLGGCWRGAVEARPELAMTTLIWLPTAQPSHPQHSHRTDKQPSAHPLPPTPAQPRTCEVERGRHQRGPWLILFEDGLGVDHAQLASTLKAESRGWVHMRARAWAGWQ